MILLKSILLKNILLKKILLKIKKNYSYLDFEITIVWILKN